MRVASLFARRFLGPGSNSLFTSWQPPSSSLHRHRLLLDPSPTTTTTMTAAGVTMRELGSLRNERRDSSHSLGSLGDDLPPAGETSLIERLTGENMAEKREYVVHKKSDNPNAPVVFLLGWAGCQDRYLAKYSQIYEEKGFSVARYTAPIKKIRSFSTYRTFALYLYEKALEDAEHSSIIFHVFSMNGCSLLVALWDLLDSMPNGPDIKSRVKGIVFDSSPANVQPYQSATAIALATLPASKYSSVSRGIYRTILTGYMSSHRLLVWIQSLFDELAFENHYAFFRMLKYTDLPRKQLYLYSKADDICSDFSIEDFQRAQKERGVEVKAQCWDNSAHVQHLRAHPEEYAQICETFAADVLIPITPRQSEEENNN